MTKSARVNRSEMIDPQQVSAAIRNILAQRRRLSPLADEIGARIVSGELKEGEALSERMFAAARGVSRTSFREAIKMLEGKGLVRARQNTGTLVLPRAAWHLLDPDVLAWRIAVGNIDSFIQDFFVFRASIEPLAAESAARRQDRQAIAAIRAALDDMRRLESSDPFGERYVAADVTFHSGIFRAAANEFLVAMGNILEVPLTLSFTLHSSLKLGPQNRLDLHETVLAEIARGNPAKAKAASLALLHDVAHHAHDIVVEAISAPVSG
jgi:DNA-binding FadR family transcriptional regulator